MGPAFDRVDLRNAAGVTKASVSDWFTGKTGALRGETLVKVSAYLGVNPAWLGHGEGPKRSPLLVVETAQEAELLRLFRDMDADQRAVILGVAKMSRTAPIPAALQPVFRPGRNSH